MVCLNNSILALALSTQPKHTTAHMPSLRESTSPQDAIATWQLHTVEGLEEDNAQGVVQDREELKPAG